MGDAKDGFSSLAPIAKYIGSIADRGPNYALIVLGALAGAVALLDQLTGEGRLSTAEFIVVLGIGGALMLTGSLLQFLTESAIRAGVADGQKTAGQEAAAAGERYIRSLEIAKEVGETDLRAATNRYVEAVTALHQTNTYRIGVEETEKQ